MIKQPQKSQVLQNSSVQGIVQEGQINSINKQAGKENEQPGKTTTCSVTGSKFMEEKEPSEVLGSEQSKNRKNLLIRVPTKESWVSEHTSFCLSPFSIEKMRCKKLTIYLLYVLQNVCYSFMFMSYFLLAAEKNASLARSPMTPLQPLCISPVAAISPPLELPSHLRGIQASSFYKTSGGRSSATCLPNPFVTPVAQRQCAQEVCLK